MRMGRVSWGYLTGLVVMGLFYMAAGVNHFVHPRMYVAIMPRCIPWPLVMIYISGIAEILGGIGVLAPLTRRFAAWGLVAMLIAFLPVHVNMCLHPEEFGNLPVWALWVRLVLQGPLVAWAWFYTRG
jgi:uncharacterized membrane protein